MVSLIKLLKSLYPTLHFQWEGTDLQKKIVYSIVRFDCKGPPKVTLLVSIQAL